MNNWVRKDLKYVWHPYTQMKDTKKLPPLLIKRAKGVKLYAEDGKSYYDTISSWWCNVHGHCHPEIVAALRKQVGLLDHVLFAGITHQPGIRLAERLVKITPYGLKKVFFSDNGSTAVEIALKMSFQYWQNTGKKNKQKFVSLDRGYHGDTVGAMSVSGVDLFNKVYQPLFFPVIKVPTPYCYRCPLGKDNRDPKSQIPDSKCNLECIKAVEKLFRKRHQEIAGFILEPMLLGAGGMIVYPAKYLEAIRELTKKYNIHLICDEIATGFGRTGKMFACQHARIAPDFLCLSKGITSGVLPLAVTLTTDNVYRAFYANYAKIKTFFHGHTYTGNPIACACALASLDIFEKEQTLTQVKPVIKEFYAQLEKFHNLKYVGDVRMLGMVGALELVKDKRTKQPFSLKERVGMRVYKAGLEQGLLLRPLGNVIYFFLPLSINISDVKTIISRTYKIIKSL